MAHAAPRPTGIGAGGLGGSTALKLAPVLALVYGLWAAAIDRSGGAITAGNVWLGIISMVVFGALYVAVLKLAPRLPREMRALAWGAFAGVAFGWLYSQTDATVLRSIGMSGTFALAVAAAAFYRFYTTED